VLTKNNDGFWLDDGTFVMKTGALNPWVAVDRWWTEGVSLTRSYEMATGQRPPSPSMEYA